MIYFINFWIFNFFCLLILFYSIFNLLKLLLYLLLVEFFDIRIKDFFFLIWLCFRNMWGVVSCGNFSWSFLVGFIFFMINFWSPFWLYQSTELLKLSTLSSLCKLFIRYIFILFIIFNIFRFNKPFWFTNNGSLNYFALSVFFR